MVGRSTDWAPCLLPLVVVHRHRDAHCACGEVDLSQKVRKADHQSQGRPREDDAHEPPELDLEQDFNEQCCDHGADQQRREGARRDCCACQMTPALKTLQLNLDCLFRMPCRRDWAFSQSTAPVNDASKAPRHDVENASYTRQQEDWSQCKLDRLGDITDVHGCVDHGCFADS